MGGVSKALGYSMGTFGAVREVRMWGGRQRLRRIGPVDSVSRPGFFVCIGALATAYGFSWSGVSN